jgi:hypothetical protein
MENCDAGRRRNMCAIRCCHRAQSLASRRRGGAGTWTLVLGYPSIATTRVESSPPGLVLVPVLVLRTASASTLV